MSNRPGCDISRALGRFIACRSAAAAIEFAMVFPLLVVLLFGTFAVGWSMHCISSVEYALEQTSRALQLDPTLNLASLQALLDKDLDALGNQPVKLTMATAKDTYGSNVAHLTVTYTYHIEVPLVAKYSDTITRTSDVFLTVSN